jgi:glucokinase
MSKFYAGIDLGGTKILTFLCNEDRQILSRSRVLTEADKGVDKVIANMIGTVEDVCSGSGISTGDLSGLGIGVPGPVNKNTGLVYDCPNLKGWKNIEVRKIFSNKFNIPVKVENDARAAGLAEARIGAAKDHGHVFYITVSTGVGGAIIIDGKIFHGAIGAAGEFGQMKLLDGSVFETHFAGPAIKEKFGVKTEMIAQLVKENDPGAQKALEHLINGIGTYLANITTLLNPDIIVIGGGVSNIGDIFIKPVEKLVRKRAFSISSKDVKVVRAGLGPDSGAFGALELVTDN